VLLPRKAGSQVSEQEGPVPIYPGDSQGAWQGVQRKSGLSSQKQFSQLLMFIDEFLKIPISPLVTYEIFI
jgi:hypothetical protein